MARPFMDGDIIAHYQNGNVNCIYTRMEDRWYRAPHFGAAPDVDECWDELLDQGLDGAAEHESGYVFVGNVRHLAAQALTL